jgi:hypothetical protein
VHRIVVIGLRLSSDDAFVVVADSNDPTITEEAPSSIAEVGGTEWADRHTTPGYEAPAATLPIGAIGAISGLSYWRVRKTGKVLEYDFGKAGLSERKVITSGELVCEYDGRTYRAGTGDTILYLTDPDDRDQDGEATPFLVRFLADHECTVAYTDFAVAEPALSATDELARTQLGLL